MAERIRRHRERRGAGWITRRGAAGARRRAASRGERRAAMLVDCLTLWLSNLMAAGRDVDDEIAAALVGAAPAAAARRLGRQRGRARHRAGQRAGARLPRPCRPRSTRRVAAAADRVVFIAAGLPLAAEGGSCRDDRQDPRHHRHRLPRRRQDDADPASAAQRQRPAPRPHHQRVRRDRRRRRDPAGLRHRRPARRTTSSSWPTAASAAPSPTISCRPSRRCSTGRSRPTTSSSRPRAWRCRSRWCKAFNWPEVRTRVTVDGVVAVVDGAGRRRRPLRRRPGGDRRAARRRSGARSRQPARGAVRGPARLRRPRRAQQDRPARWPRDARRAPRRRSGAQLRPGVKLVPAQLRRDRSGRRCSASAPPPRTISPRGPRITRPKARTTTTTISRASSLPIAAAGRSPPTLLDAAAPADRAPRHPAREGLPRRRRQGDAAAWCRASARASQHYYDRPWRAGEPRDGRLVVIGLKGLDRAAIAAALGAGS